MITEVTVENETTWAEMCVVLWPNHTSEEFLNARKNGEYRNEFLYSYSEKYIGFLSLSIRNDYVEGTSTSPVGYVEGIYVLPDYRNKGIAKEFISFAKEWALKNRCKELASDCEINNLDSFEFHKKLGFKEANRIICFTMDLKK